MRKLNARRVLVLGKGVSGSGAAEALRLAGTECLLCDENDFDSVFSDAYDLIVVSPSVEKNHRVFDLAGKTGAEVIGEIELGWRLCDKPVIAVTGTNGKTTVVSLIGHMLGKSADACVTGNIGRSFALDAAADHDAYVVETSSFQLETVSRFAPHIAVITNITGDHLDRHGSFENYAAVKLRIAEGGSAADYLALSADSVPLSVLKNFFPERKVVYFSAKGRVNGAYALGDKLYWYDDFICRRNDVAMLGVHNLENALAAIAAAKLYGLCDRDITESLKEFRTGKHRMEYVGSVRGVAFYDDSKGTNVDATIKAMRSMPSSFSLIAGGSDKGYEYDELFVSAPPGLKKLCVIGETSGKIMSAACRHGFKNVVRCPSLACAVSEAYHSGADSVLLSPASASFDMFENYKRRGEAFVAIVEEIIKSETRR